MVQRRQDAGKGCYLSVGLIIDTVHGPLLGVQIKLQSAKAVLFECMRSLFLFPQEPYGELSDTLGHDDLVSI